MHKGTTKENKIIFLEFWLYINNHNIDNHNIYQNTIKVIMNIKIIIKPKKSNQYFLISENIIYNANKI